MHGCAPIVLGLLGQTIIILRMVFVRIKQEDVLEILKQELRIPAALCKYEISLQ